MTGRVQVEGMKRRTLIGVKPKSFREEKDLIGQWKFNPAHKKKREQTEQAGWPRKEPWGTCWGQELSEPSGNGRLAGCQTVLCCTVRALSECQGSRLLERKAYCIEYCLFPDPYSRKMPAL